MNTETKTRKIKLTYFKESGKYYTVASHFSTKRWMFEVFDEIKHMKLTNKLPGLTSGSWDGPILVDSDEHPNGYPGLILPKKEPCPNCKAHRETLNAISKILQKRAGETLEDAAFRVMEDLEVVRDKYEELRDKYQDLKY